MRDPELIGVRFDGMGRAVGQAAAAPVLREQGFARVFGDAEAGEDVVAAPPGARPRPRRGGPQPAPRRARVASAT